MPPTDRNALTRLIWAAVRKLGDAGEEAMRAAVARINDRDGTSQPYKGTPAYSSTKHLSDAQLLELAQDFRRRAQLPPPNLRPTGPRGGRFRRPSNDAGNVAYVASAAERQYVEHLFDLLNWSEEARLSFIQRQTKGAGMTTHNAANAVVAPLERMLRERGFVADDFGRIKRWRRPLPFAEACCHQAKKINCTCRLAMTCPEHGGRHVGSHD